MSKNKLIKFAETETFPNFFQPSREELLSDHFDKKGQWHVFFQNNNPIVLELGCGRGEYSVGLAQLHPDKNFIAMDRKGARMWKGCKYTVDNQMNNVAFLRTQIDNVNFCFAKHEIDEIWITFPDPQPKKENKRLTSLRFLDRYRQFLASEAKINLKTDSDLLYQYTQEIIAKNHYKTLIQIDDVYAQAFVSPELNIHTYYENLWLEKGMKIKYLQFVID